MERASWRRSAASWVWTTNYVRKVHQGYMIWLVDKKQTRYEQIQRQLGCKGMFRVFGRNISLFASHWNRYI